jgi:hypothetical protein
MVIYLINLLILTALLLLTGKEITLLSFGQDFISNTEGFLELCRAASSCLADWVGDFRQGLGSH